MSPTPTLSRRRSFGSWIRRLASGTGGGTNTRKVGPVGSRKSRGVYGVPVCESICYARSTVGYVDEDAIKHRRAGIIPLVVAKCGSFLKAHALQTEGIFRISGSTKRINALQAIFDDPKESYGLNLNWLGYTAHDASTALRRYLNKLPEPVIPHAFYKDFRNVMSDNHYHSLEERIEAFQHLIQHLPIPHQHLLLYMLDLLSLFASNAAETKMDAANLAVVFAPGILSHPQHHSPVQYRISQRVLEFLIEFQVLFTMQLLSQGSTKRLKGAPPVPPLPKSFVDPRATKSDPLLPLSPQPVRPIPRQLLADVPLDEKTSEDDDDPLPPSLPMPKKAGPQPPQEEEMLSTPLPAVVLPRPRSAAEASTYTSVSQRAPNDQPVADGEEQEEDYDAPTPRAMSPLSPPHLTEENPSEPPRNMLQELRALRDNLLRMMPDKPIYKAWIGLMNIVMLVLIYELYQALWGMCCFEPYFFFVGFTMYWTLLLYGIQWKGNVEPHYEQYRGGWLGGGDEAQDDKKIISEDDDSDGLSLFDDISIAEQDVEEAMLRDTMCEWHSLLSRSWRINNNDENGQKDSDMTSIMSVSSRFNEEEGLGEAQGERGANSNIPQDYNDDYDYDNDTATDSVPDIDFHALWNRHQQILQDAELAAKIQENEKMQFRRRSQSSGDNHEEWKIRYYQR
ncbi:hypothetical protein BDB00DRAFT_259047 [Zychaea mexicana]|uniref:uncharacterized protein n=1 Tax=Zychaea mexicana TaxID=64656 RepID=UPI0022FE3659|nr:uncharacterized protein BDB00DRAFT_259047 [Zychaea mexicana]KAI9495249.1 hypothetical protein BDB00DRAFT_259047 [Zychaea mexicana]